MTSYNYGPIQVNSKKRLSGLVMWEELNFGLDSVIINDDPMFPAKREAGFLNLKSTREGIETLKNFPYENPGD